MRIAWVGNCQVASLAAIANAAMPDVKSTAFEVWRMSEAELAALARDAGSFDLVISQHLMSFRYGDVNSAVLKASCKDRGQKLVLIHNLYTGGVFPDCCYVGKIGARVRGPVSDYHSRIILSAFQRGRSEKQCLEDMKVGAGLEVAKSWTEDTEAFRHRESMIDVPYASEMQNQIRETDSFHYFNHPRPAMLEGYARKIMTTVLGAEQPSFARGVPDLLERHGSWPVYAWVSEALHLPYGREEFICPNQQGSMGLEEFISSSYRIYTETPEDNLVL